MNVLSLFSGIGGLELGLERAGMNVVGQVEIDPFCRSVLERHWPEVPKHDDVRTTVDWWRSEQRPRVDVVAGGFPCQPVSVAGRRAAQDDERWLWPAMAGVIRELRPRFAVMENVPGLLIRGMGDVLGDLAEIGYDAEWDCIPAAAVGAPHRRDRVFIVAYPAGDGRRPGRPGRPVGDGANGEAERPETLANSDIVARPTPSAQRVFAHPQALRSVDGTDRRLGARRDYWATEPDVGRVADGLPAELVARELRGLGNAVVPQVSEYIGRLVVGAS